MIIKVDNTDISYEIDDGQTISIGRKGAGADVEIDDQSVSRLHARLKLEGQVVQIDHNGDEAPWSDQLYGSAVLQQSAGVVVSGELLSVGVVHQLQRLHVRDWQSHEVRGSVFDVSDLRILSFS